jgi:hypothetical protein
MAASAMVADGCEYDATSQAAKAVIHGLTRSWRREHVWLRRSHVSQSPIRELVSWCDTRITKESGNGL